MIYKSNFIRNATCTRTNISIIINCQHVALHGCHLAKGRLPVTPSSLKITIIHICRITIQHNRRIIKVKLHILLDITKTVLIKLLYKVCSFSLFLVISEMLEPITI